jgi:hypothetical protein
MRTAGFVLLALAAGPIAADQWAVQTKTDPMTDKTNTVLEAASAEGNGTLLVACAGKDFLMRVTVKDAVPVIDQVVNFNKSIAVKGRWRIDQDKPDGITYWAPRAHPTLLEPHSNFAKDAKKFLQKLEGRQRVIFQVEAEGGTQTLTFDLAGLDTKPLSACYSR